MKHVHQREELSEGDQVVIHCSQTCNIRLMSDADYRRYKNGARHNYYGGAYDRFPAKIPIPRDGVWNITIDTVSRKAISVTRKVNFDYKIKIVRRS